ncbi:MAG: replicative DNA helicase [Elusimicrobiota bacterium]|jgi:replicative DNA helicase|nr:replicative DNA helicase [Elusimicrobiota bacterium]
MVKKNIDKTLIEKLPPQSIDTEMALLGAMMIEREAAIKAMEFVRAGDFYKELHRDIFTAISELTDKNQKVDIVLLAEKLSKNVLFIDEGAAFYLTSLIDTAQTAANVEAYAQNVREKSLLRQLISQGSKIVTQAYNEADKPEIILDQAQADFLNLSQSATEKTIEKIGAFANSTLEHLAKLHENKHDVPGLSTGFIELDKITSGLQDSELIIIAARPSMGKTSFALNIAENVAIARNPGVPTLIFSLEMSAEELMRRMLSSVSGVALQNLRNGNFNKTDAWLSITKAMSRISEAPIYLDKSSMVNIMELRARARRMSMELKNQGTPLGLIIIDYLQMLVGTGRYGSDKVNEVGEISRYLKALAKDLKVPIVALSQLNRSSEKRGTKDNRPVLSDLRDSGAIEQDADVVAFIHRDWYYDRTNVDKEHQATIIVAKQRNGPTGDVTLEFDGSLTRFNNASMHRE